MLFDCLKNSLNEKIIFFIGKFRFEGKILDCDNTYLKYFDTHKSKILYKKLLEITEWEILE